jgi:hypothetical protein
VHAFISTCLRAAAERRGGVILDALMCKGNPTFV